MSVKQHRVAPAVIVIVDDDADDRELVQEALAEAKLANECHTVGDGEELFRYLRREGEYGDGAYAPRPDLILLDLNMPRMDGRTTLRQLRADEQFRAIPVVVLTTSAAEEDLVATYDLGASGFITKPVSFESLVETVRVLDRYWFQTVKLPPRREGEI
jgi:CheY-like chemotaxis protein